MAQNLFTISVLHQQMEPECARVLPTAADDAESATIRSDAKRGRRSCFIPTSISTKIRHRPFRLVGHNAGGLVAVLVTVQLLFELLQDSSFVEDLIFVI